MPIPIPRAGVDVKGRRRRGGCRRVETDSHFKQPVPSLRAPAKQFRPFSRHPEEREARLEGRRPPAGPLILRGSLRSHLRMTDTQFLDLAARCARGLLKICPSLREEGAGKTGCALHPRSRVRSAQRKVHTSVQVQRRASGLPCAMALRLIRDRPGDRLSCHHHP